MSAILSVDDLNDFISPGVACIKPIETLPVPVPSDVPPPNALDEHEVILDGGPSSSSPSSQPAAQISLTDCLACSGCVTSAEAVLVSLQSHNEVLSVLDAAPSLHLVKTTNGYTVDGLQDKNAKLFVASISPQTRASLAATCGGGITERQAGRMIEHLFVGPNGLRTGGQYANGFTWMVDTNTAREACLVLGADEVLGGAGGGGDSKPATPVLTSSCPGWVCYAEKTHPYVLPHLSRVKSPQALMGTLLKTTLSKTLGISPDRIWHLAIMPCFDKKLEASREELTDSVWGGDGKPGRGVRDVDCVITSKEILMLAASRGINIFDMSTTPLSQPLFPDPSLQDFLFPPSERRQSRAAGTSGGNLHYVLHDVRSRHPGSQIQTVRGRNADVVEYAVTTASGETVFKAARYYGFRNIQNLVRKLKPAKASRMPGSKPFGSARRPAAAGKPAGLEYAYVEVMACPGGCTNGGGQIKVDDQVIVDRKGFTTKPGPQEQKEWLAEVDEAYFSADEPDLASADQPMDTDDATAGVIDGISASKVRDILAHWSRITGISLQKLVYTSYREVISDVGKGQATDTERVVQLAGKIGGGW
ncbi:iron hydrogenase [Echria macrotheca]|uniref:Nuclear architecture-related protein 1 n=1 Tax=Echria macrotheca TaxID=438768 RepID=A0AAJ0F973_9PEZI|nr:iron hydrogenase [Echria macrotheca]